MLRPRKYQALVDYLMAQPATPVVLAMTEIEALTHRALPASAYLRGWWRARSNLFVRELTAAGWRVVEVDTWRRAVTFARTVDTEHPADSIA